MTRRSGALSPDSVITPEIIELLFKFSTAMQPVALIESFIERTNEHWELIAKTDDVKVVLERGFSVFHTELGDDICKDIASLVASGSVDLETQKTLFNLVKSLVKISLHYIRETRSLTKNWVTIDVDCYASMYSVSFT